MTASMRVLVVDDDELVRAEVGGLLELEGMTVVEAANGRDALVHVQGGEVDVVISDWRMPVMDGLELLRRVRAGAVGAGVPFVLLTGSGVLESSPDPGPDAVLRKPVAIDHLLGVLRRVARPGRR